MNHTEYVEKYLGRRVDNDAAFWYQCIDLARHYCSIVWEFATKAFGGSAIAWWENREKVFPGKRYITGYPNSSMDIKPWDIIIFKADATLLHKKPWDKAWKSVKLTKYGHVAVLHTYADNDGVVQVLEQNGGTWNGTWLGSDAIRIRWYKWKDVIAWFILQ